MTSSALPRPGRRICVVGTSGAGKTYVAEALARILGLPYVCNDALIWAADWQEVPRDEVLAATDEATRGGGWTFDGNLNPNRTDRPEDQLVLSRCDTLVWLDLPRWQVWSAITLRTLSRVISRRPMWHGNVEGWHTFMSRDNIIWWSLKTFARRRQIYGALFANADFADRALIRLRSRREVNAWLATLTLATTKGS